MVKQYNQKSFERRGYLAPLVLDIKKVSSPILGKKGLNFIDIVTNWQSIAGSKLSGFSTPLRLKFPTGKENGGVLHISVAGGVFATEFFHQKPFLLEKINSYFGYTAISDIKIIQDSFAPKKNTLDNNIQNSKQPTLKKELSPSMQNIIADIKDTELKEALTSLAKLF